MTTFTLTDVQAQAILDMRLARLTSLEVTKLETELARLKDLIKRYTEILKNPKMQLKIVKKETMEIGKTYGGERKTTFETPNDEIEEIEMTDIAPTSEDVHVIYSPMNTIKSVSVKYFEIESIISSLSICIARSEKPTLSCIKTVLKRLFAVTFVSSEF